MLLAEAWAHRGDLTVEEGLAYCSRSPQSLNTGLRPCVQYSWRTGHSPVVPSLESTSMEGDALLPLTDVWPPSNTLGGGAKGLSRVRGARQRITRL